MIFLKYYFTYVAKEKLMLLQINNCSKGNIKGTITISLKEKYLDSQTFYKEKNIISRYRILWMKCTYFQISFLPMLVYL